MEKWGWIYILMNKTRTVSYIGVTKNLQKQLYEYRNKLNPLSFTAKYNIEVLVYFERFEDIVAAISREKQLKKWKREWKEELIQEMNPE